MILGFVNQQELTLTSPTVVADTINYLTAEFTFLSEDWQGVEKYAHFVQGDVVECHKLKDGKIIESDGLNLTSGKWGVYVRGEAKSGDTITKRIMTEVVPLVVESSGAIEGEPIPSVPTNESLRIWNAIGDLSELQTINKKNLVEAINEANQNVESGTNFETDETLRFVEGKLSVNTADSVEADNSLPITSAAVYTTVGNIDSILKTI